jgi:transcriptional regulator with XRE-family HTH domain
MSDFSDVLRRLMAERGLGVREVARQVPCNPGHLSNLRSGKKRPSLQVAARLDDILGAGGTLTARAEGAGARAGGVAGRALVDDLMDHAVEFGRWTEAANVGPGTVELLDEEIHRVARESVRAPLEPLIHRAVEVSRRAFGLLQRHQRLRQRRDLYVIGAKAGAFLACALGDVGQQAAAAAYARTGLIVAEESGHPAAVALAMSAASKVAFWDGRHDTARLLARQGFGHCPANSTRVLLACQEADASNVPAAREAISRAGHMEQEISQADDLPGLFSCGRARRAGYAMTLGLREGDWAGVLDAAREADAAGRAGEDVSCGTWGQVQLNAALAYLGQGEVEGAAARLDPVLVLPAPLRLVTFGGKLACAAGVLAGPRYRGSAAAGGLAGQINDYLAGPGAGTLAYPVPLSLAGQR